MANVIREINTEQGIYDAALLVLSTTDSKYNALSQLSMFIDNEAMQAILDVFGGTSIYVPTQEEMSLYLKSVLVAYICVLRDIEPGAAAQRLDVPYTDDIRKCVGKTLEVLGAKRK